MAVTTPRGARLRPITGDDLLPVGRFLEAHLNASVPAERWAAALCVPWAVDAPNHGFMLVDGDEIVGAHLAFYADRVVAGRPVRVCNLGAWCVLPSHRLHGLKLLKALLAQDDCEFTDFTPSGNVVPLNRRLGFRELDVATALVPNLPWPAWPGRIRLSADPAVLARTLSGAERRLHRDHRGAAGAHHVVLMRGDECCYVVFRTERRKGLPLFARVLHVGDRERFWRMWRRLSRHLLLHHGAVATFMEERIVGRPTRSALRVPGPRPRPRMFRGPVLRPDDVDYFYSELVCLAW